jgi:hypothetical protein
MNHELVALLAACDAMTPEQYTAQRKSWVVGELMIQHPDMSRDEATAIYETANTGEKMNTEVKDRALELLADPNRTFGRAIFQSLSEVVGQAIVQASNVKLASQDFESIRSEILRFLRTPASQT